jgi:pimeloyl-ACP methyl ester carboxylesterase
MIRLVSYLLALAVVVGNCVPLSAEKEPPVERVASQVFSVTTAHGTAQIPFEISLDWSKPQPQVVRAVVIFHGKGRDVEGNYRSLRRAAELAGGGAAADSILIAPQFLNEQDAKAHHLAAAVLRWRQGAWESGADAAGPAGISAYEVIDNILSRLADPKLFPNLKIIVLAGHSGGGQAVQRYAVIGQAERIVPSGVRLRYVVANPSSYVYFSDERPVFEGDKVRFAHTNGGACPNLNHWKYGTEEIKPEYVRQNASSGWRTLEEEYAQKEVLYLLGTADIDPREKDLDISCAGEAEGPNRFLRGQAYYLWLHHRHASGWNQHMWFVPGVAHSAGKMFTSQCGVAALFEQSPCPDQSPDER